MDDFWRLLVAGFFIAGTIVFCVNRTECTKEFAMKNGYEQTALFGSSSIVWVKTTKTDTVCVPAVNNR